MVILTVVKVAEYHDSVTLMLAAKDVLALPGMLDCAIVMGTPANREILESAGMLTFEAAAAGSDDLVIAVKAESQETAERGLGRVEEILRARARELEAVGSRRARTLESAIASNPDTNLVVISVAGRYAATEARTALELGRHILLFSDNVSLDQEIALKRLALERDLLCMGPDAGTAIINGIALGFANAVPRGPVGLVSASGTGLQAVTCGIARAGVGTSQAIGVGSRDLSAAVGGAMMIAGLRALQADPSTEIIVLISKPPADPVMESILAQTRRSPKPTIICFLGTDPGTIERAGGLVATTLTQAAALATALAIGREPTGALAALEAESKRLIPRAAAEQAELAPGQHYLRGLFAGGSFCYEAQLILKGLPEPVFSNAPLIREHRLTDSNLSVGHTCVDLGEDEFTQGRLHPMIDPTLRNRRILQEASDSETAVILFDVVLGYGAHPDPAGAMIEAIREAARVAEEAGRHIVFIASICGTDADPQKLSRQEAILREAGVIVMPDNASAARLAGLVTSKIPHDCAGQALHA